MEHIITVEEFRKQAYPILKIPNFEGTGHINIRVQRPKIMRMAIDGQIPNHLMDIAMDVLLGERNKKKANKRDDKDYIKELDRVMHLYCRACMVQPKYEDVKDYITEEQVITIFQWGIGEVSDLNSFRDQEGNGDSNNDGEALQEKTE